MTALVLVAALTAAAVQAEVEVRAGAGGVSLAAGAPGHLEALLTGVSYQAVDDAGLVFKTTDARLEPTGEVAFSLEGPAAAEAKVTARLSPLLHGFRLDWSIVYTGAKRKWDGWASGFRYSFARENSGAKSCPVTRWVRPTGAKSWEVPGDALYPDLEWQLRQVIFGDTALVIADSEYNPDWFYQGDLRRVGSSRRALPSEPPFEIHNSTAFLILPTAELDPVRVAAEAAGRPLTVALSTGRTGNLFAPQEPISLKATVDNVSTESRTGKLAVTVHDYQGNQLLDTSYPVALGPLARTELAVSLPGQPRGVLFVDYRLSWEGGEYAGRTTVGILPDRKATGTLASSPFGMSSLIATPERYPDQYDFATVSALRSGLACAGSGQAPSRSRRPTLRMTISGLTSALTCWPHEGSCRMCIRARACRRKARRRPSARPSRRRCSVSVGRGPTGSWAMSTTWASLRPRTTSTGCCDRSMRSRERRSRRAR
ncbi:MAG: hypothetical protein ABFE16_05360 [Armatimonadia bacterium]